MSAIDLFKSAAVDMQKEDVVVQYAAARKAFEDDADLQKNMGEFNLAKINLNTEMEKAEADRDEDKITELNMQIGKLYNDVLNAPSMLALNQARTEVEDFIGYINVILNAAIDGEDPMLVERPEPDCGGSCSSCAGCH